MNKQHTALKDEADYLLLLAKKVHLAAHAELNDYSNINTGTINNLAPEIRKTATKVSRLTSRWSWEEVQ